MVLSRIICLTNIPFNKLESENQLNFDRLLIEVVNLAFLVL